MKNGAIMEYRQINISGKELEKIRSEINTNYAKYRGKRFCMHASYGLDKIAYFYYFVNRGFDDYTIYSRVKNTR